MDDPLLERLRRALAPEFELDRRLAAGGMGIVYRAREVALDRPVAVKVLRPELATAVARERFLREARLLARLQHPNVVPVHRADERDGLPFYVMDLIEGRTLADRLSAGPLPAGDVATSFPRPAGGARRVPRGRHHPPRREAAQHLPRGQPRPPRRLRDLARRRERRLRASRRRVRCWARGSTWRPSSCAASRPPSDADQYSAAAVLFEAASGRQWKALDAPGKANWRGVPDVAGAGASSGAGGAARGALAIDAGHAGGARQGAAPPATAGGERLRSPSGRSSWPSRAGSRSFPLRPRPITGRWRSSRSPPMERPETPSATWWRRPPTSNLYHFPAPHEGGPRLLVQLATDAPDRGRCRAPGRRWMSTAWSPEKWNDAATGMLLRLRVTDSDRDACRSAPSRSSGDDGQLLPRWAIPPRWPIGLSLGRRLGTDARNLASRSSEAIGAVRAGRGPLRGGRVARRGESLRGRRGGRLHLRARALAPARRPDLVEGFLLGLGDARSAPAAPTSSPRWRRAWSARLGTTDLPRRFEAFDSLHDRYSDDGMLSAALRQRPLPPGPLGREGAARVAADVPGGDREQPRGHPCAGVRPHGVGQDPPG